VSPSAEATFDQPYGIAFDHAGALYVADSHNHRIMKVAR
jgi:sugar lactone lactonase YvrE